MYNRKTMQVESSIMTETPKNKKRKQIVHDSETMALHELYDQLEDAITSHVPIESVVDDPLYLSDIATEDIADLLDTLNNIWVMMHTFLRRSGAMVMDNIEQEGGGKKKKQKKDNDNDNGGGGGGGGVSSNMHNMSECIRNVRDSWLPRLTHLLNRASVEYVACIDIFNVAADDFIIPNDEDMMPQVDSDQDDFVDEKHLEFTPQEKEEEEEEEEEEEDEKECDPDSDNIKKEK